MRGMLLAFNVKRLKGHFNNGPVSRGIIKPIFRLRKTYKNKLILWLLVQDLAYSIYNYPGATKVDSGEKDNRYTRWPVVSSTSRPAFFMFQYSIESAKGGLPGVWPDFLVSDFKFILAFWNPPTADKIGFVLGLFFWAGRRFHFHNPL